MERELRELRELKELKECLRRSGYELLRPLGQGAFSKVYLVRRSGGQVFACKTARGQQAGALLRREALLLKRLEHPVFPRYGEYAESVDYDFLFMEYVEGADLAERLKKGPFDQKSAVRIALALAEGLRYLHRRPGTLLYRDLKPENVRLMPDGQVRLLDLGCVCRAEEARNTRAGTRGFAAPEQFGESVKECAEKRVEEYLGPQSDVYALGRLLYYMLSGGLPVGGGRALQVSDRKWSPALNRLIADCTEPDPCRRPADMQLVIRRLKSCLGGWQAGASGAGERYVFTKNICKIPSEGEPFNEKGV